MASTDEFNARAIARRPIWKNRFFNEHEFVAVMPIRKAGGTIEPGERLDKDSYKMFVLRSLYIRRYIGIEGSDWLDMKLRRQRRRLEEVESQCEAAGKETPSRLTRLLGVLGVHQDLAED